MSPPSDEGTYGSRSESCDSSDPLHERYLCVAIHDGNINNGADPPLGSGAIPPPNPPPKLHVENEGNRGNPANTATVGSNRAYDHINLNVEGWCQAREAVRDNKILPVD